MTGCVNMHILRVNNTFLVLKYVFSLWQQLNFASTFDWIFFENCTWLVDVVCALHPADVFSVFGTRTKKIFTRL